MKSYRILLLLITGLAVVISGIGPYDRTTWWLEVAPILIGVPIILATNSRFPLTTLTCTLLTIHAVVLATGGHYSYARVPLGTWAQNLFGFSRNHYDRLGHFMQGFVPAIVVREILLRASPLRKGGWLFLLTSATCLAISALYEFGEWWAALIGGEAAELFLGTQGDVWDTQWDMFLALVGAIVAQLALSRAHDRSLSTARHPTLGVQAMEKSSGPAR